MLSAQEKQVIATDGRCRFGIATQGEMQMDTPETIDTEVPDRPARSFFSIRKLVVAMVVSAIFAIARSHLSPKEAMAAAGDAARFSPAADIAADAS